MPLCWLGAAIAYLICAEGFAGEVLSAGVEAPLDHPRVELHEVLHLAESAESL